MDYSIPSWRLELFRLLLLSLLLLSHCSTITKYKKDKAGEVKEKAKYNKMLFMYDKKKAFDKCQNDLKLAGEELSKCYENANKNGDVAIVKGTTSNVWRNIALGEFAVILAIGYLKVKGGLF